MAANQGRRSGDDAPGPGYIGLRAIVVGLAIVLGFLVLQRGGEEDRRQQAAFASTSGTIRIADLPGPVEILRDDRGIPHIRAGREGEGWFGLGFAHAQDRLAQMLWLRRKALGRSAEVAGETSLASDRLARVLEIGPASDAALAQLPSSSREVLEAYSAGVNARIARVRKGREEPPRALRAPAGEIEPWKAADSLALVKLLAWCMGGTLETTLVLDELIQRLDSVPARPFFPTGSSVDFGAALVLPDLPESNGRRGPLDFFDEPRSTRRLCEGIGIPTGTAWVVAGQRSESGAPMVVADWHLAPAVPALFYEAQVEAGGVEVAGATIPGSPIVWAGRNRWVAWGSVPASAPVSDIFMESLREDRLRYQNGREWVAVEEREEILGYRNLRGRQESVSFTLRRTRHGPLIEALYGELRSAERTDASATGEANAPPGAAQENPDGERSRRRVKRSGRALAWTGAREGDGLTSMLGLLRANSASAVRRTLEDHHEPVLAVAYADRDGDGGVQVAGWIAKRPLPTGLVPVQGRLRAFEWRNRVSLEQLPDERLRDDGARDWVITADQPWPTRPGLDQTEWLWRPGQRAARLQAALEDESAEGRISLRANSELLTDHASDRAPRVVSAILSLARVGGPLSQESEEIARLLARWDGSMSSESAGAAAYHLVMDHLIDALLRPAFGDRLFTHYVEAPHVRVQISVESLILVADKLRRPGGWTDEERVSRAARESLRSAWIRLNQRLGPTRARWAWGGLHRLSFLFVGSRGLSEETLLETIPSSGNAQTVFFAAHRPGSGFLVEAASMYRVAMDLSSSDDMLSTLAPGQSEHPGHPHFADGLGRYASSRLALFATNRLVIEEESIEKLLLEPAP